MENYLVMRIESGAILYKTAITRYPQYKRAIDAKLAADGFTVSEDGIVFGGGDVT